MVSTQLGTDSKSNKDRSSSKVLPSMPLIINNEILAQVAALEWNSSSFLKKDFLTSRPLTSLLFRAKSLEKLELELEVKNIISFMSVDTILYAFIH